jgi:hypothetical protein
MHARLTKGHGLATSGWLAYLSAMGLQDVLDIANGLSREEKTILCARLGAQIAKDFSADEVADIKRAVAEADAEFERGECLGTAELAKEIGL